MSDTIDYDGAWKEALDIYLKPFLEFCFPDVASRIDWSVPPEPQDKEFQEIVREADLGKQRVDKLVKVRGIDGADERVLIHIEVQTQFDDDLPRRMYRYHHRIVDRYGARTVTLAAFADRRMTWCPSVYEEELWGCRVRFEYPVCKFLDFNRENLDASGNPAAIVIAAHMAAQATPGNMDLRKQSRMRISRHLYEAGYGVKDIRELLRLINWLMVLPDTLEQTVREELEGIEEEKTVPFIPYIERFAHAEGVAEGLAEGMQQAAANVTARQARKRFPEFGAADEAALRALPLASLETLAEALLDFAAIGDLREWLADRPTGR